jgi:hypothetical protein
MKTREQPNTTTPDLQVTDVNFQLHTLDEVVTLIPDIVTLEGAYIPSPILSYLAHANNISTEAIQNAAKILCVHKYIPQEIVKPIEYNEIMNYTEVSSQILGYIIKHHDKPDMAFVRHFPRVDYIRGLAFLLRKRLDIQFERIQILYNRKTMPFLAKRKAQEIHRKIIEAYQKTNSTIAEFNELLDSYEKAVGNEISAEFKFNFYQTALERILSKATFLPTTKVAELKAFGAQRLLDKLETYLPHITDPSYHLHFLLYQSRVASTIDHDTAKANEYIKLAKTKLTAHLAEHEPKTRITDIDMIFNVIALHSITLHCWKLENAGKADKRAIYIEIIDDFIFAKDSIKSASDINKGEYTKVLEATIQGALTTLEKEAMFFTVDTIDTGIAFAEQLKRLAPLFASATLRANVGVVDVISKKYEAAIDLRIEIYKKLKVSLQNEAAKNAEKFDELAKLNEEYNNSFKDILNEFSNELKEISKNKKPSAKKTEKQTATTALVEIPVVDIGENANDEELDKIEASLQAMQQPDRAEMLLYQGDRHLRQGNFAKALETFQEAFDQTNIQDFPNQGVIESIKMQLWCANKALQLHIQKAEATQKRLAEKRRNFILELGMKALVKENTPAKDLNLKNQACWDRIYQRGDQIFVALGKEKKAKGLPLSEETLLRDKVNANLEQLQTWHATATALVTRIEERRSTVNFPTLSDNKASLFQPKETQKMPAFKKTAQQTRKKKHR